MAMGLATVKLGITECGSGGRDASDFADDALSPSTAFIRGSAAE